MGDFFPGKKLLYTSTYGPEEYLIVILSTFVVAVMIKHLVFHTAYFWWYSCGQFYIPNKWLTFVTGKTLTQRIFEFVSSKITPTGHNVPVDIVMSALDEYFKKKEFAPSVSTVKGDVLDNVIVEYKPSSVLVIGCHVGYCLLRILQKLPENATVLVIEPKEDFIVLTKKLLSLVGWNDKVVFLSGRPTSDVIKNIRSNYGVQYFDFIFLNRTNHGEPSHVSLLKLLEGDPEKKNGYFCTSQLEPQRQSVILADKVVVLGDVPFLKYVRQSGKYESKYFQLYLEHCPQEIIDGMEMAIFTG